MSKKQGFTILELLVVIAIIGILSAVIIAALASSRDKSKVAAFKEELDSLRPELISKCHDAALVAADLPGGSTYAAFTDNPSTQSCGQTGDSTFSIEVVPKNGATCTSATITETKILYVGC